MPESTIRKEHLTIAKGAPQRDLFEPGTTRESPVESEGLLVKTDLSIAISLKRIADYLERKEADV